MPGEGAGQEQSTGQGARARRVELVGVWACVAAACWLAMMVAHECGHVVHGVLSGGRVSRVVLLPWAFSRTDFSRNPHPAFVAWGGVVWGSVLPLLGWVPLRRARLGFLARFFAGFCLVANGAYLVSGVAVPAGDTEDLLRLGVSRWEFAAAGLPLCAAGLALWNGLGGAFGLTGKPMDRRAVVASLSALAVLLGGMLIWSAVTRAHGP